MMPGMDAEMQQYDPTGQLETPDGAALAGMSGGGYDNPGSPTCMGIDAGDPFPGNPGGGTPQ